MKARALFVPLAAVAAAGCTARSLEKPNTTPAQSQQQQFPLTVNRKLDLLFMVDNSPSMETSQANLIRNFNTFIQVLSRIPDANGTPGLPDVHIAVVTSDLGIGYDDSAGSGCTADGDGGRFQYTSAPSAGTACDPMLAAGAHFIADDGHGNKNYTGDLAAAFSCIASVGAKGCGFERQLHAVARALGADSLDAAGNPQPPPENAGFLRSDAYLGIILITNEDDCSASTLRFYDQTVSNGQGTPLGPPNNYRCNHFGHICDGVSPRWDSPTGASGFALQSYASCQSDESGTWLFSVRALSDAIKRLKPDPDNQILVAAITGPTTPYVVDWFTPAKQGDPPWPQIEHSCPSPEAQVNYADPAVRVAQWVQAFGGNGLLQSICDDDFGPSLTLTGNAIAAQILKAPCVGGALWDADPSTPGVQAQCNLATTAADGSGGTVETPVPSCDASGGTAPCYRLVPDAASCGDGYRVDFTWPGAPPDGAHARAECRTCPPGINAGVAPGAAPVDPGCP